MLVMVVTLVTLGYCQVMLVMVLTVDIQGMSQAFTVFPALAPPTQPSEEVRPTTAPPPTSLETPETGETSVREEETKTTIHFLEFPHKSYSYAVLEKKWSL